MNLKCVFVVAVLCFQFLESQAEYHRRSLDIIESVLPSIKSQQGNDTKVVVQLDAL